MAHGFPSHQTERRAGTGTPTSGRLTRYFSAQRSPSRRRVPRASQPPWSDAPARRPPVGTRGARTNPPPVMTPLSARTPPSITPRRQGNADLRSAQPAEGGRREGPRVQGWFASRPEPRRSASSGRVRGTRLSLRFAQRCRPPPGELARGRRSLAGTTSGLLGFPRRAAFTQQLARGRCSLIGGTIWMVAYL